jgi:hypothetical protein
MNQPTYPFQRAAGNRLRFEFESVSPAKRVRKVVEYQPLDNQHRYFNLALLDQLDNGTASDLTVSNNADLVKILATVFQTMRHLFRRHPTSVVVFKGSTAGRTRLYRMAIAHSLGDVVSEFYVEGLGEETGWEPFRPNQPYVAFSVRLRNPTELPKLEP